MSTSSSVPSSRLSSSVSRTGCMKRLVCGVVLTAFLWLTLCPPTSVLAAGKRRSQKTPRQGRGRRSWQEGDVRLVGGGNRSAGIILMYHKGKWGSVCDDMWNSRNDDVVCRQQGFPGSARPALNKEFGGRAKRRIWITRVQCQGHEKRLLNCSYVGWGFRIRHMCKGQWRAVGVVCKPKKAKKKRLGFIKKKSLKFRDRQKWLARKKARALARRKAKKAAALRRKALKQKRARKTPIPKPRPTPAAKTMVMSTTKFNTNTKLEMNASRSRVSTTPVSNDLPELADMGMDNQDSRRVNNVIVPWAMVESLPDHLLKKLDKPKNKKKPLLFARGTTTTSTSKTTKPAKKSPKPLTTTTTRHSTPTSLITATPSTPSSPTAASSSTTIGTIPTDRDTSTITSQTTTATTQTTVTTATILAVTTTTTNTLITTTTSTPYTTRSSPTTTSMGTTPTNMTSTTTPATTSTTTTTVITTTITTTTAIPTTKTIDKDPPTTSTRTSTETSPVTSTTPTATTTKTDIPTTSTSTPSTVPTTMTTTIIETDPPTTTPTSSSTKPTSTPTTVTTTVLPSTLQSTSTKPPPTTSTTESSSSSMIPTETMSSTTARKTSEKNTESTTMMTTMAKKAEPAEKTTTDPGKVKVAGDATLKEPELLAGDSLLQADSPRNPDLEMRVSGGRYPWEGLLEIREKALEPGDWGTICGDDWGMKEVMVVCRELGLNYAKQPLKTNYFGGDDKTKMYYSFNCTGREAKLSHCQAIRSSEAHKCLKKTSVAGVVCATFLPDLIPNLRALKESTRLQDRPLYYLQCAMEENCLSSSAYEIRNNSKNWRNNMRRLLRFSTIVHNRGVADFRPNVAKSQWEWHSCHMHYHSMEVFAHYDILDDNGTRLAEGSKASFCLEDTMCDRGVRRQFQCAGFGDQGLSVNCSDNYLWDIDCQWIDITDIKPGTYTFLMEVNPSMFVAESDFDNNVAECDLWYSGYMAKLHNCRHSSLLDYRR